MKVNKVKVQKYVISSLLVLFSVTLFVFGSVFLSADYTYDVAEVSTLAELQAAVSTTGTTPARVTLLNDIVSDDTSHVELYIPAGARIVLLGEYNLYATNNSAAVTVSGHFTLDGPTLTRAAYSDIGDDSRGVLVNGGATFVMLSGTISGHTTTTGYIETPGAGVTARDGADFYMNGGTISNNTGGGVFVQGIAYDFYTTLVPSYFIMNGGYIVGNNGWEGAGLLASHGEVIMNGGTVSDNIAHTTISTRGGGIALWVSNFVMNYGRISENAAGAFGGGIYLTFYSTMTMYGGYISDNSVAYSGGGIYIHVYSKLIMNGGEISDNIARSGGGVAFGHRMGYLSIANFRFFTMNGGYIINNSAQQGSGVDAYYGEFLMNEGEISGNFSYPIGNRSAGVNINGGSFTMHDGIISDNQTGIDINDGIFIMFNGIIRENANNGVMLNDSLFTMHDGKIIDNLDGIIVHNSEFILNNGMISDNGWDGVFIVAYPVHNYSSMTMYGGVISGNLGSGVAVMNSIFTMNNGTISSNLTIRSGRGGNGGGVSVFDGIFIMNNGIISGNTATGNGGGVYINESILNMYGGAIIGNSANEGGGICIVNNSTFTMNGGIVGNNTAHRHGGGVFVHQSEMILNDGIISQNAAGQVVVVAQAMFAPVSENIAGIGGGIYISYGSTFTMNDGDIIENIAANNGGGIASRGTFLLNAGEIRNNVSGENGGGIWLSYEALFERLGGEVNGNLAGNEGDEVFTDEINANEQSPQTGVMNFITHLIIVFLTMMGIILSIKKRSRSSI